MTGVPPDQQPGDPAGHPLLMAISPLVDRIGATVVDPGDLTDGDVPLVWDGSVIAGIRMPATTPALPAGSTADGPAASADGSGAAADRTVGSSGSAVETEPGTGLDGMLADLAIRFGAPLAGLPRPRKQEAVRMLEESGAFSYRKSVETVAAALGISRFTVYNYLNRDRG